MKPDDLYEEAAAIHCRTLERLVYDYEADPEKRADLLQEIHMALWRRFKSFEDRCSVRKWVYRMRITPPRRTSLASAPIRETP